MAAAVHLNARAQTAETGYLQRKMMKALEDLAVMYDNTVRNSVGGIVQFAYGDDSLDPILMESAKQPVDLTRQVRGSRSSRRRSRA